MTVEEMIAKKRELGMTSEMISSKAGIPLSTVQKVFGGITKSPRKSTLVAIEKVLREEEAQRAYPYPPGGSSAPGMVRETAAYQVKPKEKKYTIDDYYAMPEDRRVELIDGVIYDMTAPRWIHQMILGDLYVLFRDCVEKHGMPCEVGLSPIDVRLDRDNYTMVQPDLIVLCSGEDVRDLACLEGAPDLAVEILSPSTRSKDQVLKLYKYKNAGVREYWIVDPKFRIVTVHFFESEDYIPKRYSFDEEIPVEISDGKCVIDFSKVAKRPFRR